MGIGVGMVFRLFGRGWVEKLNGMIRNVKEKRKKKTIIINQEKQKEQSTDPNLCNLVIIYTRLHSLPSYLSHNPPVTLLL